MDILSNLPDNKNNLSNKIAKANEIRRIKSRTTNFISQVLDFVGEENNYISNGLSWSSRPIDGQKISEEDKKELINVLVSEIKSLPEKLKAELNNFFEETKETKEDENKKTDSDSNTTVTISAEPVKASTMFGY
jgi:flagellar motility protein MotE (MotC chaperone)